MIFLHAEADRQNSVDYLNRLFAMEKTGDRYYVLMLSSLEFIVKTSRANSFERKVLNESISEYLTAFPQKDLSVPFAFYIEDAFYVVLICKERKPLFANESKLISCFKPWPNTAGRRSDPIWCCYVRPQKRLQRHRPVDQGTRPTPYLRPFGKLPVSAEPDNGKSHRIERSQFQPCR
ncbi:MAG: hypothetical protein MZU97_08490 [Bacillus subtilis]|nr:hypothetical protein [Bacillus subtilis]